MMEPRTGTVLIASGDRDLCRQAAEVARVLGARLGQPVVLCLAEGPGEPVIDGIRDVVAAGAQRLVMIPFVLSREQDQEEVPPAIKWASRRWPFLSFHAAAPLAWTEWSAWLQEMARDTLSDRAVGPEEAAVLLVGGGDTDPSTNANLARLAQLVRESRPFARVDHAFLDMARPSVAEALQAQARLGLRNVVALPWLLSGHALARLAGQVARVVRAHDLRATVAAASLAHPTLLDILTSHHQAALADSSFLAPTWTEIQAEIARGLGPPAHAAGQAITAEEESQLRELDRKINELLPSQYQGRYNEICPEPMGAAALKLAPDGKVAWDEMWTSFCELALAGGPPHRETLLEAVPATEVLAEPEKYQAVVAEIERGITLVTGLPVAASRTPGWVGVRCESEDMAIWLMRAIVVENVMARREGTVIYLPAGPRFTMKNEIKNVVTVVAKTSHYWTAHVISRRRRPTQSRPAAVATPAVAGGDPEDVQLVAPKELRFR